MIYMPLSKRLLAIVLLGVVLLSGCASSGKSVKKEKRPSLPEDTPVSFIYAPMTPIIPETSEYITSIETSAASGGCEAEGAIKYLERQARARGANLIFVRRVDKYITEYTGVYGMSTTTRTCTKFLVDLLANFSGGKNEN